MTSLRKQLFLQLRRALAALLLLGAPLVSATTTPPFESGHAWLPGLPTTPHVLPSGTGEVSEEEHLAGTRAPLTRWTARTLDLVVKYRQNPLRAARSLAYVHAALHDALLVTHGERAALRYAAAHEAAAAVLDYLYPQEAMGRLRAEGVMMIHALALPLDETETSRAHQAAKSVSDAAIARAWRDGAERVWPIGSRPQYAEGQWKEAPPLRIVTPTEALAGEWKTWALRDGGELQPPPPPAPNGEQETKEMAEVLQVSRLITEAQKEIARRWNLDHGTVTPPGVWNKLALAFAKEWGLDDIRTVMVLAAMNAGMMDAMIACWRSKFTWWSQRPITALRRTVAPDFTPVLLTPPFPGYVSGHATVSGAASAVLAGFFPERRERLDALAEEAAMSRLYGGIHIRSDNDEGLALGRAIGDRVIRLLQAGPRAGPDASGTGKR